MNKQDGFSLIELMIGLAIGSVVLAGAGTMFVTTFRANLENVKQQRFEQSVQVLNSTMAANIRRAGLANTAALTPQVNTKFFEVQGGDCITFSYETTGVERFYGYKVENKIVYAYDQPKVSGNADCIGLTNWAAMTDTQSLEVTALGGAVFVGDGATTSLVAINLATKAIGLNTTGGAPSQRETVTKVAVRNWK